MFLSKQTRPKLRVHKSNLKNRSSNIFFFIEFSLRLGEFRFKTDRVGIALSLAVVHSLFIHVHNVRCTLLAYIFITQDLTIKIILIHG